MHDRTTYPTQQCKSIRHVAVVALLSATLVACGGDGAGDPLGDINPFARELVEPFVGVYDITGDWNGSAQDEALLVIREPDILGVSEALIYDFDEVFGNCYRTLPEGEVRKEPVGTRVFLNDLFQFQDAVLSLSGDSTLVIEHADGLDVDRNGDTEESRTYRATRVAQLEQDIQPVCTTGSRR